MLLASRAHLKLSFHRYFESKKWTTFKRQLSHYLFRRVTKPRPDRGTYFHELFLLGRPDLVSLIFRPSVGNRGRSRGEKRSITITRTATLPEDPDFYHMPTCRELRNEELFKLCPNPMVAAELSACLGLEGDAAATAPQGLGASVGFSDESSSKESWRQHNMCDSVPGYAHQFQQHQAQDQRIDVAERKSTQELLRQSVARSLYGECDSFSFQPDESRNLRSSPIMNIGQSRADSVGQTLPRQDNTTDEDRELYNYVVNALRRGD